MSDHRECLSHTRNAPVTKNSFHTNIPSITIVLGHMLYTHVCTAFSYGCQWYQNDRRNRSFRVCASELRRVQISISTNAMLVMQSSKLLFRVPLTHRGLDLSFVTCMYISVMMCDPTIFVVGVDFGTQQKHASLRTFAFCRIQSICIQ